MKSRRCFASRLAARRFSLAAALMLGIGSIAVANAQRVFESPEQAMTAFGNAIAESDEPALKTILGANFHNLIPPVGAEIRYRFLEAWASAHAIQAESDKRAFVAVGRDGWTLPIPIVKSAKGWQFDTRAGAEEIRVRRIGRNERAVIQTMLAIYDAQREYATEDRDGDGVLEYASRLSSSPGKRDGLYWPAGADEKPSPLGPALAAHGGNKAGTTGYHGYRYKLLNSQGPHAPGGALDYVVHGNLFGGFALIAWPVRYRDSGVTSFITSHDGQVYERDLGPDTPAKAAATKSFDPGPGWSKVSP